ncbi:MAG: hypothetical protein JSS63_10045 [Bacteroidetes bacterium]|nr:hypothetical protein [Bacteroidota bacterium]
MTAEELIAGIITTLSPIIVKGGDEIIKYGAKELWDLVKKPFKSEKEKNLLNDFEKYPDSDTLKNSIKEVLQNYIKENPDFAKELQSYYQKAGGNITNTTITESEKFIVSSTIEVHTGDVVVGDKNVKQ